MPSGPPGPTYRTLDQVEPRIPLSEAPVAITNAGSYYLTQNLSNFVAIAANNVTLDLMGFSIHSPFGSAITMGFPQTNIVIRNGFLSAANGSGIGFNLSSIGANGLIEDVIVQGVSQYGISVKDGFTVRRCQISQAGDVGIRVEGNSVVEDNQITGCAIGLQGKGLGARFARNLVFGNEDNYLFVAGDQINLLLSEIPEALDWPCSATFAGTLSVDSPGTTGILVNADQVTIDLAGHSLVGPGQNVNNRSIGIYQLSDRRGLTVKNGTIVGWRGFQDYGIRALGEGVLFENLIAVSNYWGFLGGDRVVDCVAAYNINTGMIVSEGTVEGCSAVHNGFDGIAGSYGLVRGCNAIGNGHDGISLSRGSVIDCLVTSNGVHGVSGSQALVRNVLANYNGGNGIDVFSDAQISSCMAHENGASGFAIGGTGVRIEDSHARENQTGFSAASSNNLFIGNTTSGNATNWSLAAGNVGLVVSAVPTGPVVGDSGGASPGSTNPFANFTF
ncbi:MAG: right-handed parallel beta-helix repeat-containing protein [Verrucomicrobia bacterium]|nr:right-handed parallel beta-helix repeat-containing protein [Verrucomicrobiota bacterium]